MSTQGKRQLLASLAMPQEHELEMNDARTFIPASDRAAYFEKKALVEQAQSQIVKVKERIRIFAKIAQRFKLYR